VIYMFQEGISESGAVAESCILLGLISAMSVAEGKEGIVKPG
jgi:hypothetical protein